MTIYMDMRENQRKIPKWLLFKNSVRITKIINDHISEAYVHIHVKDEVSMTTYMDKRAYKRKVPKWLLFENYCNIMLHVNCKIAVFVNFQVLTMAKMDTKVKTRS